MDVSLNDAKNAVKVALFKTREVNGVKPAREISLAITKLQEALHWLNELEEK